MSDFRKDIESAINCHNMEAGSDTPDWILAEYLAECLRVFDAAVAAREKWYNRHVRSKPDAGTPEHEPAKPATFHTTHDPHANCTFNYPCSTGCTARSLP